MKRNRSVMQSDWICLLSLSQTRSTCFVHSVAKCKSFIHLRTKNSGHTNTVGALPWDSELEKILGNMLL